MFDLDRTRLESYLSSVYGTEVVLHGHTRLGETLAGGDIKGHGYGEPLCLEIGVDGGIRPEDFDSGLLDEDRRHDEEDQQDEDAVDHRRQVDLRLVFGLVEDAAAGHG